MNKNYRTAVGYLRVSTPEQAKGTSLDTQIENIKNLCIAKNILLVEVFVDTYSGKNFKRPEFEKAFKYLADNQGEIDLFLTNNVKRYTRDLTSGKLTTAKIKKLGVDVNYVEDWMEDINSPHSEMIIDIKMAIAEYERKLINFRTRRGERESLKSGRYIFTPPRGYERAIVATGKQIGKKGIKPNSEAPFIAALFQDYSLGIYTQEKLIEKYKLKGFKLSKSRISKLLENPLYAGLIDLKKYNIPPYNTIKGIHQAIISEELFYKAQEVKTGRNRMQKTIRPKNEYFPLSANLLCPNCGSKIYGSMSNNGTEKTITRDYGFYRCKSNCGISFKPNKVHKSLQKALSKVKPSPNIANLFQEILLEKYQETKHASKKDEANIKRQITKLEQEQINLVRKYSSGNIPDSLYNQTLETITQEIYNLKIEKSKYSNQQQDLDQYLSFGMTLLLNLDKVYLQADAITKQQLLGSYFTDNLIFDGKKFRTLPFNDTITLLCKYNKGFKRLQTKNGSQFFNQLPYSTRGGT